MLFDKGCDKVDKEMDITRIVRKLRELRLLMKGRLFNDELAFLVKNDKKNIINIGESTESDIDYDQFTNVKTQKHVKFMRRSS